MLRKKILVVCALICCVGLLVGCSEVQNIVGTSKGNTQENIYVTSMNAVTKTFYDALDGFQDDVKNKNVDGMKAKVNDVQGVIDSANKLDVPESCKGIQKQYIDGFTSLKKCLEDYVQVYSDQKDGKQVDTSAIQKNYDAAINNLKAADKAIYEL